MLTCCWVFIGLVVWKWLQDYNHTSRLLEKFSPHSLTHSLHQSLTCSFAPRTWWVVDKRKWRWHFPGREPGGCRRQWSAASGAAAWQSLDTHTAVKEGLVQKPMHSLIHTHIQVYGKDTRHSKWLSKGMESAAPGDLPGSNVNQDEMKLQQQLTHLHRNKSTLLVPCDQS